MLALSTALTSVDAELAFQAELQTFMEIDIVDYKTSIDEDWEASCAKQEYKRERTHKFKFMHLIRDELEYNAEIRAYQEILLWSDEDYSSGVVGAKSLTEMNEDEFDQLTNAEFMKLYREEAERERAMEEDRIIESEMDAYCEYMEEQRMKSMLHPDGSGRMFDDPYYGSDCESNTDYDNEISFESESDDSDDLKTDYDNVGFLDLPKMKDSDFAKMTRAQIKAFIARTNPEYVDFNMI